MDHRAVVNRMIWCLRIVVLIQCVGVAGRYLFSSYEIESDVYGLLYFDYRWTESLAQTIDNTGSLLTVVAGILICLLGPIVRDCNSERRWFSIAHQTQQAAALVVFVWMLLIAIAQMMRASNYAELALAEHAVRYCAPLAIFALSRSRTNVQHASVTQIPALRFGIAGLLIAAFATFAAHGYKAIDGYGPFVDLILLSELRWTNWGFDQQAAEWILLSIGWIDIIVAALLFATRSRIAAAYMTVWGFVTAASRITSMGTDVWPETLVRVANGGVPLALLIYLAQIPKPKLQPHDATNSSGSHTVDTN